MASEEKEKSGKRTWSSIALRDFEKLSIFSFSSGAVAPEPPPREPNFPDCGLVPPRPASGAAARGGGNLTDCGLVQKQWKTPLAGRSLQMAR